MSEEACTVCGSHRGNNTPHMDTRNPGKIKHCPQGRSDDDAITAVETEGHWYTR